MSNIECIGYIKEDAKLITPEQALHHCLEHDIGQRGAFAEGKKLLILALDDNDNKYDFSWNQAGMSLSQIISLLEVFKQDLIHRILGEE